MQKLILTPEPRILRQFAFFGVIGLPLICFAVMKLSGHWSWTDSWTHPAMLACAGIGVVQLVLLLAGVSAISRWLYAGIMVVAFPIGFVLSQVLMATIYYLVITPIGLAFRLIGRDVIGRRFDAAKTTYWHERGPARNASSYFKLY